MAMGKKTYRLHDFLRQGRKYKRIKGQVIQTTENSQAFNLIESGYVKRYLIANDGSLGTQVIYGPGDFFSVTEIYQRLFGPNINQSPEVFYYEAMTNAEIFSMNVDELVEEAEGDPLLYKDFLLIAGNRLYSTLQGLENVTMPISYKRVAHELLYLARRFGEPKGVNGMRLKIPLTHQDIADMLSLTRETVSSSMSELRRQKLITSNRHIVIPNLKKLHDEAYGL